MKQEINVDAIPAEMKERDQWVVWKRELRDPNRPEGPGNRPTKPLYSAQLIKANGFLMLPDRAGKAKSNDPETWCSFKEAVEVNEKCREVSGIGYCFAEGDGLAGVDLDHCFEDGKLLAWASQIVSQFDDAYIEYSPSGDGLHIWCKGQAVKAGKRVVIRKRQDIEEAVEVYDATSPRYFTVTGKIFAPQEAV